MDAEIKISQKSKKEMDDQRQIEYLHKLARERAMKKQEELRVLLSEMLAITKGKPITIDNSNT